MDASLPCRLRIKESFHTLPPKEKRIAEFVLQSPEAVIHMSMEELARSCGVSLSAIVRLAKNLGYAGFKEMVRMLSNELALESRQGEMQYQEIHPGDPVEKIFRNMCLCEISAIQNTLSVMDIQQLEAAVDLLCRANRVDFYGVGSSGLVAEDAHTKFLRINKYTACSSDPHNQRLMIAGLKPGDAAVLISYSGATRDLLEALAVAREQRARIILVTRFARSPGAEYADLVLCCGSNEGPLQLSSVPAKLAQLFLLDVLFSEYCRQDLDRCSAARERVASALAEKHL